MTSLTLIGEPRWRSAAGQGRLARIDAALLGLLALAGPQPRDRVAAWLWPQVPLHNANLTLRQRLYKLRQQLGHPVVHSGAVLQLAPGVTVDVGADRPHPASGELLGGLDFGDLDAFDNWLAGQRDALELQRLDQLAGEAARLESQGALAGAIALSEQIVGRRPLLEHGWRRLMRLHYLRGDRVAAVAAFERFEQQACRELGLRPSPETLALLDAVERLPTVAASAPGLLPAALTRPPRLVGRDEPLGRMAQAWAEGRAVLLLGQGGIGKSRLLEAFVEGRGAVLTHRARPGMSAMPYACVGQLLAQAQDRFAPELAPTARQALSPLHPAFGPTPESAARQALLWQAAESLLAACALHGLAVVAVDDLHHADAASLELLYWLLGSERLTTLRWCCAARQHDAAPGADTFSNWMGDSLRVEPVMLTPLPALHVAELVESLALPAPLHQSPDLVAALVRHAGGHPFFTLEALKGLWLAGGDAAQVLPRSAAADALIARRLDRLTSSARDLLRLLALAGADLRLDLAAQVLAQPLPVLAQAWSELDQAQLTYGNDIAHDLVRDCVLARLPAAARQALHLALAMALEQRPGVTPIARAEHWLAGQAWPEATCALSEAARQARLAGRLAEYETLLDRTAGAATLAQDEGQRFNAVCLALSARMLRLGADVVLAPLAQALLQAGSDAQRSRLQAIRCEALLNLGHAAPALQAGTQALALAPAASNELFEARVLHGRALALCGDISQATLALESARDSTPALADPARLMQAHAALAHGLFAAHRHVDALQAQQAALAIAEQLGDATEVAHHLSNLASIAAHVGDVPLAHRAASDAHQRFVSMGMRDGHFFANAITLSRHAVHLGRLDVASAVLAPVLAADPSDMGAAIHALARVVNTSLRLVLGQAFETLAPAHTLASVEVRELLPVVQASVLLARLRHAWVVGIERHANAAADRDLLLALGLEHPTLRDNPALYREWARWDEPAAALSQLARLAALRTQAGAVAAARSMELAAVELLLQRDPAAAARRAQGLASELPRGTMAGVHLPEAWWLLARALRGDGRGSREAAAQRCVQRAQAWIHEAVLPDPSPAARQAFLQGLPAHRALLAAQPLLGARRRSAVTDP